MAVEILREYLKGEPKCRNLKKEHIENVGFYNTRKELDRETGKHRRQFLSHVAHLYQ